MTKPFSIPFISAVAILFACSAVPAFAQHGGGGHGGGGFHGGGGGGFHGGGGGGSRSSGGASRGGPAPAGAGYSRGTPGGSVRSGGSYERPGANSSRSFGNSFSSSQRMGNSASARPAPADGQWHSFGGATGGRAPETAQSQARSSANPGSGWHVFSANRATGSTGVTRSFTGQGGEVWENAPAARNVVPASRALSNIQGSLHTPVAGNTGLRGNPSLSASSRFAAGSTSLGNRAFSGSLRPMGSVPLGGAFRFGNRFNRFNRFGGGCWNCGFGFGGWGFGWPWLGFWDPFWFDPWWGSGPAYGYGYYGYPNNYVNVYPDSGYSYQNNDSAPPPQPDDQYNQDGNWVTPNGPNPSAAANSANLAVPVLIYLKSGAVYTVRDYWIVDGELHYILISGARNSVDLEQVDLPRTNTENAKSGVKFIFKSEPSITTPAQPNSQPGSPNEPAPAPMQQIKAVPQPEART
jgi:hypothetical protein